MSESVTFSSTDGLSLEGCIDAPDDPKAVVVVCHPHPRMGGTMNAPLLDALSDELKSRRWAVFRFNFRGIGASEGQSQLGIDEVADARGVLEAARRHYPSLPIALVGWSFGAAVALRTLSQEGEIVAAVLIAPAIKERPGITAGAPDPAEVDITTPTLIVVGANDHLVDPGDCKEWANRVPAAQVLVMKGANHFFWAKYDALGKAVGGFLDEFV